MNAAGDHRGGQMVRAGDDVADDFRIRGIGNAGFEDANDRGGAIADASEANRLADHAGIFFEDGRPEAIRENDDAGRVGAVVLRSDRRPRTGCRPITSK